MPAGGQVDQEQGLQHRLSAGQMAMVAVGGSIGTGLLLGSAAAMEIAGPGVILSFVLAAHDSNFCIGQTHIEILAIPIGEIGSCASVARRCLAPDFISHVRRSARS